MFRRTRLKLKQCITSLSDMEALFRLKTIKNKKDLHASALLNTTVDHSEEDGDLDENKGDMEVEDENKGDMEVEDEYNEEWIMIQMIG